MPPTLSTEPLDTSEPAPAESASVVSLTDRLDDLSKWRRRLRTALDGWQTFLAEQEWLDDDAGSLFNGLRARLESDKLVLAFVAEFSRGKSELINALFFADQGQRILPATPGRTTMCPVELGYDPARPAGLVLLPIDTRLDGRTLSDLRRRPDLWESIPLQPGDPHQLTEAMAQVMRTKRVSIEHARALGFWDDENPEDNPPQEDGRVEVPLWRHALINYPHPLLARGLVVLDTPGLNAIGAEPELTLGLLPFAHAIVFMLAADTGVTKSDLSVWREHLGAQMSSSYVALNKIDALVDPLASAEVVRGQIERQQRDVATTLGIPIERVFPMSAREALAARIQGDVEGLARSRLPELEAALAEQLLPQRRKLLQRSVDDTVAHVTALYIPRRNDQRRQIAEQMLELRGLRGKSGTKLKLMLQRIDAEAAEFELCTSRLMALRTVHQRLLQDALADLSIGRLQQILGDFQARINGPLAQFGARRAFGDLCTGLRQTLAQTQRRGVEIREMLEGSYQKLNADFGFSLTIDGGPEVNGFVEDVDQLEAHYGSYLGIKQSLRLAQPQFREQFRRMLSSRLRVMFENLGGELELWSKTAAALVDTQLRERRRSFARRRESLERVQSASQELEQRIAEIEALDQRLQSVDAAFNAHAQTVREIAGSVPAESPEPAFAASGTAG